MEWVNTIGLFCDLIGAVFLSYGLIISKKEACKLGSSYYGGETDEENINLPPVQDRLKQSLNATIGMFFLVVGFLLQIIGSWPR
jgi:hypothetical protein